MLGFFATLTALMDVSFPLITRAVIDAVDAHGAAVNLWPYAVAYIAATTVLSLSVGCFIWAGGKIRTHISHDIRRDGFENLQRLSFSFYDHRPVGWLMARMTSDSERLANILAWAFLDIVWGVTLMIGIAIAMLAMNVKLALLALAVIPFLGWVSARFQKRMLRSAREVRRTNSRITGTYNESIMGVLTSKAFVRESENLNDFKQLTGKMYDASVQNMIQSALYVPIIVTLASLSVGLTLAVGGFDLLHGVISVGTLVAFMAYARNFFDPIEQLGRWFAEMQMAQASAERIISLIDAVPAIRDSDDVIEATAMQRNLSGAAIGRRRRRTRAHRTHRTQGRVFRLRQRPTGARSHQSDGKRRRDDRDRRRHRRRQEHARQRDLPVLRTDARRRADRRHRLPQARPALAAVEPRHRAAERARVLAARSSRTSATAGSKPPTKKCTTRRGSPARTTSSPNWPTATRPKSAKAAAGCRPVSGSWCRSRARSSPIRRSS